MGPGRGWGAVTGHRVRGPHAWSLPGFYAKGNPGVDMLVVWGQLGPHMPPLQLQGPSSGSTLQLGQGDGSSAPALCPTTRPIRGCVVPLGRGGIPKAAWLQPPARLSPVPRAALSQRNCVRACQGQGQRLAQRGSNKILLPADLWEVTAAISTGFSWRAQAGERGMLSLQIPEGMDN